MAGEWERLTIWLGRFGSEDALQAFLEERYDDDDEDAPISDFADSQDEFFYDHDFMESSFAGPGKEIRGVLRPHSFSRSWLDAADEAYRRAGGPGFDSVILMWGDEIKQPRSVAFESGELILLGRFACDPRAGTA